MSIPSGGGGGGTGEGAVQFEGKKFRLSKILS